MFKIYESVCLHQLVLVLILLNLPFAGFSQKAASVLISNVLIFDSDAARLSQPSDVLVSNGRIAAINPAGTPVAHEGSVIDGKGRILMPGLIDVHVHLTFGSLSAAALYDKNLTPDRVIAICGEQAEAMLLRGFTSVRDVGGPIFDLKEAIDQGRFAGPKVWPAGAIVSQSSGTETSARPMSGREGFLACQLMPSCSEPPLLPTAAMKCLRRSART